MDRGTSQTRSSVALRAESALFRYATPAGWCIRDTRGERVTFYRETRPCSVEYSFK